VTCTAHTRGGRRCRRPPLAGREVCHAHSGARVGRSPALTAEVHDRIVAAKKAGCPDWVAAQSAGLSTTTYYELLKRGEAEESGPARELLEAIRRPEADAYLHAMASWRREMNGNWRAAVAYVDRVDRGRFASSPDSDSGAPARSEDERIDLSGLWEEQLAYLEDLYADTEESEEDEE
jgi:uncharacterized protein (DUF849 family)